jgi:hypothetical protein
VSDIDSERMVILVEQGKGKGPQRHAITAAVGAFAVVVAGWTSDDVAVPGP